MDKSEFKILIINDEVIVAYSFFLELANNGFTKVYFSKTYEEALLIVKIERPYLVIQDIAFNPENGRKEIREDDFCYYLKRKYRINHIYISGYLKEYVKKTNAIAFLLLPPQKIKLIEAVEKSYFEYTERIIRRSVKKYRISRAGIKSIRKIEIENRPNINRGQIAERKINGRIIRIVKKQDEEI